MSSTRDHSDDVAAYVLGALEPDEATRFAEHLESCAACREEVAALGQVVDVLPIVAPAHPVPRRLRRRVFHAVREDATGSTAAARLRHRWSLVGDWPRRSLLVGAVTAAIALAVIGALELSSGQGTKVIRAEVTGISGSAQVRLSGGHGVLVVRHMPLPPPGKIYEVWLKRARGAPRPTSVLFSVTSSGSGDVGLPGDLHRFSEVLVTPEPAGGSQAPTHTPVIVARLS
ncbi:MAG: anti-sigma factor [Solirubrobacteraceae bacterium]